MIFKFNRNKFIDKTCSLLKKFKKSNLTLNLRSEFGTPEENSAELLKLVTKDFDKIRNRKDAENLFVGRFLGTMLLIESKIVQLLEKVDSTVDEKTLGRKIDLYKETIGLLKDIALDSEEVSMYLSLVAPLKELAKIRNDMAHDLNFIYFDMQQVKQTDALVKKFKPQLAGSYKNAPPEMKPLLVTSCFGFLFSEKTAVLQQILE